MVRIFISAALAAAMAISTAGWAGRACAQTPVQRQSMPAAASEPIGSVASIQGSATVARGSTTSALKTNDNVFQGDVLQTGSNGTLAVTLEDETTFTLSASTRMTMDEYAYQSNGKKNAGAYNVLRGTVAFVAGQVARTG